MDGESSEMTLRDYGLVVKRRRWLVATSMLLTTIVAVLIMALQTPIYESDAGVLIEPQGDAGVFDDRVETVNNRVVQTQIQVIEGEALRARVQQLLGLDELPPEVSASAIRDTDVISMRARDPSATNAQVYANAYATTYVQLRREQSVDELVAAGVEVQIAIDELETQIAELAIRDPYRDTLIEQLVSFNTTADQLRIDAALRNGGARVIRPADLPTDPIEPTPIRTVALALLVGLVIGLAAAFLIDYLDEKVRVADDLERLSGHPVLAVVPIDPPPDSRPIALSEPAHVSSEAYRGLRTNLQFRRLDTASGVIQVTSSLPAEGKTTTASNLAVVLAQSGHRVALVDADLRRPRLHEVFSVPQSPGLTDLLLGSAPRDVVRHVTVSGDAHVSLYCSGTTPTNPSEMLGAHRMRQLLTEMGGHYDFVIIDSAPVLPVSDALALANAVDGVLLVAQADRATESNMSDALGRLERVSAPVLGFVLNQARTTATETDYGTAGYVPQRASEADLQVATDGVLTDATG